MLFALLLSAASAASPVQLPPGESASAWSEPLALAGLAVAGEGSPPAAIVTADGTRWTIRVVAPGAARTVVVAAPATLQAREDLAWLVASLLQPVGVRAPSPAPSVALPRPVVPPPVARPAPASVPRAPARPASPPPAVAAVPAGAPPPPASEAPPAESPAAVTVEPPVTATAEDPTPAATTAEPTTPQPTTPQPTTAEGSPVEPPAPVAPGAEGDAVALSTAEAVPIAGSAALAAPTGGAASSPVPAAPPAAVLADLDAPADPSSTEPARLRVGAWFEPTVGLRFRPGLTPSPDLGLAAGLWASGGWRLGAVGGWEQDAVIVAIGEGRTVGGEWVGLEAGWVGERRLSPAIALTGGGARRHYAEAGEPVSDVYTPVAGGRAGGRLVFAEGLAVRLDASVRCDLRPTELIAPSVATTVAPPCGAGALLGLEIAAPEPGSAVRRRATSARASDLSARRQSTNPARTSGHQEGA